MDALTAVLEYRIMKSLHEAHSAALEHFPDPVFVFDFKFAIEGILDLYM
jgi:hypothetical protein